MTDLERSRSNATAGLLRLIDYRVHNAGCNPPFELADCAIDAITQHVLATANEPTPQQLAENTIDIQPPSPGATPEP